MIAIITEANSTVATGHLVESVELASALLGSGQDIVFFVNEDCNDELLERIPCAYRLYSSDKEDIFSMVRGVQPVLIVTDLRCVSNEFVLNLRNCGTYSVICIDECGHRRLDADIIINPMIDPYYWVYQGTAKIYSGAEYLILSSELQDYRKQKWTASNNIKRICVSMGGVDIKGTTLKLAQWLPKILPKADIELIIGSGFQYEKELKEIVKNGKISYIKHAYPIYKNFLRSDVTFCAGGNTLHELACLGIPTIVIPTMPHELRNGHQFEKKGFGKCLAMTDDIDFVDVQNALRYMENFQIRLAMHVGGREKFDGLGLERTREIIMNTLITKSSI